MPTAPSPSGLSSIPGGPELIQWLQSKARGEAATPSITGATGGINTGGVSSTMYGARPPASAYVPVAEEGGSGLLAALGKVLPGTGELTAGSVVGGLGMAAPFMGHTWDVGQALAKMVNPNVQTGSFTDTTDRLLDRLGFGAKKPLPLPDIPVSGSPTPGAKTTFDPASGSQVFDMIEGRRPVPTMNPPQTSQNSEPEGDAGGITTDGDSTSTSGSSSQNSPIVPNASSAPAGGMTLGSDGGIGQMGQIDSLKKQYEQALADSAAHPYTAPTFQASPTNQANFKAITTPNAPGAPETFGHKLLSFLVAGSGPLDPTRLARQENELRIAQQQLDPKQALQGQVASDDLIGAQNTTRAAQLHQYETGGMSPQTQAQLDMLRGQLMGATGSLYERAKIGAETSGKIAEEQAGPDYVKTQADYMNRAAAIDQMGKVLDKYPDLMTPGQISKVTGGKANEDDYAQIKETLAQITKDRGFDPQKVAQAQLLMSILPGLQARLNPLGVSNTTKGQGNVGGSPSTMGNLNLQALKSVK